MNNYSKINTVLLSVIAVLLIILVATNFWIILEGQRREEAQTARVAFLHEQAEGIAMLADLQDEIIFNLFESYEDTAYGPSVDRIAEQQLIAAEHQLMALQSIALQNRQIAELLLLTVSQVPDSANEGQAEGD